MKGEYLMLSKEDLAEIRRLENIISSEIILILEILNNAIANKQNSQRAEA